MNIRKLEQTENAVTRTLYENIFSEDSKGFVDYYYSEKTKENQIYVIEEDNRMVSMIHLNPYTLMVNGMPRETNYIVAVATEPEYRRRGYMAALLKKTMEDMNEVGQLFTFLMPASEAIYTPHDFRTVYEQRQRYVERGDVQVSPGMEVKEASETDCEEIAQWANRQLSGCAQVYARRDAAYYERLIREYSSDGGRVLVYRRDGQVVDCRMEVPEIEDHKAKIMIRILDARKLLSNLRLKELTAVCFRMTDPILEKNNGCVVLTGTEYSGVMLMDAKSENAEGTLTVAALTELIFGAKTVEEICVEEGVSMTERMKAEMRKIEPLSRIYLNEIV